MPDTASPSVFISYSREDSAFVDRLEADLRARGFRTWVDRRRLEGGQDWQAEIDRAIDQHDVMVLVLTPDSTESSAVAHELEYANRRRMRVIPLLQKNCQPHFKGADGHDLPLPVQWIQKFLNDYALGLTELLGALLSQQFSLTAPTRELYFRATDLRTSSRDADKELAAIILQHILERDPNYQEGLVKRELDQLTASLYASRAQNLRQQVLAARKTGEYGVEASALEALLALGRPDPCATEYLPLARQNSQFVDLYWVIQQQTAKGELNDARDKRGGEWQGDCLGAQSHRRRRCAEASPAYLPRPPSQTLTPRSSPRGRGQGEGRRRATHLAPRSTTPTQRDVRDGGQYAGTPPNQLCWRAPLPAFAVHVVRLRTTPGAQIGPLFVGGAMTKQHGSDGHDFFRHAQDVAPGRNVEWHADQAGV